MESRLNESDTELKSPSSTSSRRPQVIVDAMKVLNIRDHDDDNGETTREERAILNNLCRTAWRKLEEKEIL